MSSELDVFENCFLTLPSVSDGDSIDNCQMMLSDHYAVLKYEKDVPVIILLGWAGCKKQYLKKYSAIYEKKCITICYIAPVEDVFFRPSRLRRAASEILQLIVDRQLHDNPVFVHAFSNGGCRVYRHLSDLIHNCKQFTSLTLCGVIFDSAPSKLKILRGYRVYASICNFPFFVKYFVAACLFLWLAFAMAMSRCIPFMQQILLDDNFWVFLCEDPARCPQLYLYSVGDAVIPYSEIEDLIAVRRSRGVQVLAQRWDDSAHVSHLIAHRETYVMACLDFLQRCLNVAVPSVH